jgi:F-type H+-transporting ATPase subunit epsilon
MYLEIISPEATIYSGKVLSVSVPGESGSFQMLSNHAPIVSNLKKGSVIIEGDIKIKEEFKKSFISKNGKTFFEINSGTIEMNNNTIIILSD